MAQGNSRPELLNIKEAAAYLRVSEASLRRWTNVGKLDCLRLGAKRERRFRHEDLEKFLERRDQPSEAAQITARKPKTTEVLLEGVSIEHGNHICTLYENDLGRIKWAVPFLIDGLNCGDCCFLVSTVATRDEILSHVRDGCANVDQAVESGQLILSQGIPNGNEMCRFVERSIIMARKSGYRSFRLVGDMSWCRELGMTREELFAYEQQFDREIGHSFPLVSVCQYDVREFSGSDILNAMKCHEDTFNFPTSRFFAS